MESITPVGITQSEHYYTSDNYGSHADEIETSKWFGKGAAKLGLAGTIHAEAFRSLLHAVALDGRALHARRHTLGRARAGVDITFGAPKSVSQKALVGGDKRLIKAHQNAVTTTLSILESCCAQTRIAQARQRYKVHTGNLTIGQFLHDISRAKDPHLHTHCLVFNFTQRPDGQWQSLDNNLLYQYKMLGGLIYRNELAIEVQKLGYAIEQHEGGLWEIAGYQPEALAHFSKRSQQIKAKVGKNATSKQKEWAALSTRPAKEKSVSRKELDADWQAQAAALGIVHPAPIHPYFPPEPDAVRAAVEATITNCEQRESPFTQKDLQMQILSDVGRYCFESLEAALHDTAALELLDSCNYYVRPSQDRQEANSSKTISTDTEQSTANRSALEQFYQFLAAAKRQTRNPRKHRRFANRGDQGTAEHYNPDLESAQDRAEPIEQQSEAEHHHRDTGTESRAKFYRVGSEAAHNRGAAQPDGVAKSTKDEFILAPEAAALGWSHDSTADPTELSRTADEFTAQSLSQAQYNRDQDQTNRSPAELISDAMVDASQEADLVEANESKLQLHKPQPNSEQWQRAEFLIDYAVAAINRIGQHQVENDAYWAAWDEDKQHLLIGRKSNQAVIVEAYFKNETEQWDIDYSNVSMTDWQDFKDRQQARQQEEREYYHGLYNHFAPHHFASAEQRDRVVAKQVWRWAEEQGLEERAAAKEAALTLVYQAHVQHIGQQQGNDVALAYVNHIVREATAQH